MNTPLIEIKSADAAYQQNVVLKNVSLTINELDFIGIIGPNGGGKTTLLKLVLGLIKPSSGTVEYRLKKNDIGYLPQGNQIDTSFPITVKEVVSSGLIRGIHSGTGIEKTGKQKVESVLSKVGMYSLQNSAIGELSGGELQRTMLARSIISTPKLLVLDEPDTYVDNSFEKELYLLLKELNRTTTILLVSHDIGTISPYIKTIACVNRDLHYHSFNEITEDQLKVYNCPIEIITHGSVPHRVMKEHK